MRILDSTFDQMDNLGSAWHAREEMDRDFIILNGDTLFVSPVVRRLCNADPAPVRTTISRKRSFDSDDMKAGDLARQVDRAIRISDVVIVVLSKWSD